MLDEHLVAASYGGSGNKPYINHRSENGKQKKAQTLGNLSC